MKLRFLWLAVLAAAVFLSGCTLSESSSGPESGNYDPAQLTEDYLAPIAISGIQYKGNKCFFIFKCFFYLNH